MSGGCYDYLFSRVRDVAHKLQTQKDARRQAFGNHLIRVADALHQVEWIDSDDMTPGDEMEAIMDCIRPQIEFLAEAKEVCSILNAFILEVENRPES
jgi:hypothetical protein